MAMGRAAMGRVATGGMASGATAPGARWRGAWCVAVLCLLFAAAGPRAGGAQGADGPKVWVNAASRVYHCPGTKYYGATRRGSFMPEREAVAAGARAAGGRSCAELTASRTGAIPPRERPPAEAGGAAQGLLGDGAAPAAGDVWVNTSSRVFHCAGSRYFGATARGRYMPRADAEAAGYRAARNGRCG